MKNMIYLIKSILFFILLILEFGFVSTCVRKNCLLNYILDKCDLVDISMRASKYYNTQRKNMVCKMYALWLKEINKYYDFFKHDNC